VNERWRSWLVRAEALLCTGMPGAYRVIVFVALQHVYSLEALGHTASEFSLAQLAGFFTAIGWASLILVRVPIAENRRAAVNAFYTVASMAALTTIAVCCIALIVGYLLPDLVNAPSFVSLLCGWSTYQLARHFFISQKSYRTAVLFDLLLIGCSFVALYSCASQGVSSSVAVAVALLSVSFVMFATIGAPGRDALRRRFDAKGLQFGMTGFLSSGVNSLFVPLASVTCGANFAGGFSLVSSITSVAVLLPRAISTTQLPDLAKLVASNRSIESTLKRMHRAVRRSNIGVLCMNALLVTALMYSGLHGIEPHHRSALFVAGLLLSIQYAIAMSSAVPSNVLMIFENAGAVARVNLKNTAGFAAACALLVSTGGKFGFLSVLSIAIIAAGIRNRSIAKLGRRATESYASRSSVIE
jgi:hypothetical protein